MGQGKTEIGLNWMKRGLGVGKTREETERERDGDENENGMKWTWMGQDWDKTGTERNMMGQGTEREEKGGWDWYMDETRQGWGEVERQWRDMDGRGRLSEEFSPVPSPSNSLPCPTDRR
ncbi:hypothetical protein E2C01_059789 [Portunus trituberculatus]|uniref:Uncharacterized protein n=1 Tax=Portunus trituberculatus TaxID=210409 RepID=A0A5B7GZD6_PORTR|nr:hypothetical protein [Portunus trituberculatus]